MPVASIGPYVVARQLGEGTFAEVVLVEDRQSGERYAIKLLRPKFATSAEALERFHNEARCADVLRGCEHIVRVHEVMDVGGRPALRMEYVDGTDLAMLVRAVEGRGLPPARALAYVHDVAYALQFAHQLGIAHRDVKPSNCLVDRATHRVFLTDFGIALREGAKRMTMMGTVMGTPAYMAPEVIKRGATAAVPASDVYAVGVMLFELLTGTLPFDDPDPFALTQRAVKEPAPAPSSRVGPLPPGVDELTLRCLAKKPSDRYADGGALFAAISDLRARLGQLAAGPSEGGVVVNLCDVLRPVSRPVEGGGLTIGADPDNHFVVAHSTVSGRHAVVSAHPGGALVLTDQSTNGTWLRGHKLHHDSVPVDDGELFYLGRQRTLRFLVVKR